MNDRRRDNSSESADGSAVPPELRGLARLLDERGVRERARLGGDALERIFAASELQRPLGLGAVSPVVGRISPARSSPRLFLRLAAVIAALAGLGVVIVLALSTRTDPLRDEATLADGRASPAPVVGPESTATEDLARPATLAAEHLAAEHFDLALEDSIAATTNSRPSGAVIVALADRRSGALAGFAAMDGSVSDELEPLFTSGALFDGDELTYDGLSQEIAAVARRAPSTG